jgi:hypothetical protein
VRRAFHTPDDPYVERRIRSALAAGVVESETPSVPKPTPLDHLKRWKIAAVASRSEAHQKTLARQAMAPNPPGSWKNEES